MKYHPDIELLLKYTSGQLEPAVAVAVSIHHHECEHCQLTISQLEAVGGEALNNTATSNVEIDGLDKLLTLIDNIAQEEGQDLYAECAVAQSDLIIVKQLSQRNYDNLVWEKVTGKISKATVAMNDPQYQVELLKFAPHAKIPKHTHRGQEFTLVLQGDFRDHQGRYHAGEFIVQTDKDEHQPIAGSKGCICLAVTDAPLKFTGTFGPVINWLTR